MSSLLFPWCYRGPCTENCKMCSETKDKFIRMASDKNYFPYDIDCPYQEMQHRDMVWDYCVKYRSREYSKYALP